MPSHTIGVKKLTEELVKVCTLLDLQKKGKMQEKDVVKFLNDTKEFYKEKIGAMRDRTRYDNERRKSLRGKIYY